MKKLFILLLVLVARAGTIFAESGMCGENLTWNLTDGVLTITGTGAMMDYWSGASDSWYSYRENITSVIIEDGVSSIGDNAFYECYNLTSIEIPNSITSIGLTAFYRCSGLTNVIIPNNVTSIGGSAFSGCSHLTNVTIPNDVTSIKSETFHSCFNLTNVTIGNNVMSIGNFAFFNSGLTSVLIPSSVTSIGKLAFASCSHLTSITCEAVRPPSCGENVFSNVSKSIPLYVPAQSVGAYSTAQVWWDFTCILPIGEGVEDIQLNSSTPQKYLRDGQLFILRGDHTYTLTGAEVK